MKLYRNELIKGAMAERGIPTRVLADAVNISHDTISRARTGKNLSVKNLRTISSALNLPMRDLFEEVTEVANIEIANSNRISEIS